MSEPSELEQIVGAVGQTVELDSGAVAITPLRMGEIPAFSRALQPLLPKLNQALAAGGMDAATLVDMMADGEHLLEAIAVAARLPRASVDELELDGFVLLALAVLEVNADFFARRLMPAMNARLAQALTALGGIQGSDSSNMATGTG